jgi:hypothetical protein
LLLPVFRLYGLLGCPHCIEAEAYLRSKQVPVMTIIANDDPIASAGVNAILGSLEFPVMCYTPAKEIIKGFNEGEYARLVGVYRAALSAGAFDLPLGTEQPLGQNTPEVAEPTTGAA